jgi:gliding motility-associated-like protein
MKEQNIEKLFRDAFSNFEADVNPSVWTNVEQGLPASPQNIPGNSPLKPAGFFGKITLGVVILATAISATLVGTVIYFSSQKPASKNTLVQTIQVEPQASHATIPAQTAPAAGINTPVKESKAVAEKQVASKAQEKAHSATPVQQTASSEKKSNNVPDNSMQVSTEKTSASAPVQVPAQQHSSVSMEKTSTPNVMTENNQLNGTDKVYTPPSSTETSPAIAGPSNNVPATNEEVLSAPEEQFRFFIPNVFTPNGDLINDYFTPIGNTPVKDYELTIYDRYGFEIYRSRDVAFPWDGKLRNGEVAASAVYVYIIKLTDFKDEEHDYMGHVALLK